MRVVYLMAYGVGWNAVYPDILVAGGSYSKKWKLKNELIVAIHLYMKPNL